MRLSACGLSLTGKGLKRNEDYYCVGPFVGQTDGTSIEIDTQSFFFRKYGLLCAVADGSSPGSGGELASRVMLQSLTEQFYSIRHEEGDAGAHRLGVAETILQAEKEVQRALEGSGLVEASATLGGFALFEPDTLVIFHVGDCRVLRECASFIRPLTGDHTTVAPDPRKEKHALTTEDLLPPILTRTVSFFESAQPEIRLFNWGLEDTYMAGTKGWHGDSKGITRETIKGSLAVHNDMAQFVACSVDDAIQVDGRYDATLVALKVF